jgi:uroporphyrinogen-III decarboxylase
MNGQERFIAALRCEEIDQIPIYWMDIHPQGSFRSEFDAFVAREENPELAACVQNTPIGDLTLLNWFSRGTSSGLDIGAGSIPYPMVFYNVKEDRFYTKKEAESLPLEKKRFRINYYGAIREYNLDGQKLWYAGPYFRGSNALERMDAMYNEFGAPWDQPIADSVEYTKQLIQQAEAIGFPHAVFGNAPYHFEGMLNGLGPQTMAYLMRRYPSKLHGLCEKYGNLVLEVEQLHLEAGHHIIKTGDDLGQKDRALLSPQKYKEFFFPNLKARCDLAHKYDAVVFMHSCGFIEEFLQTFLEAGLDGLQSLEVAAGNDLERIRPQVRDKMALVGGIDSSRVLTFGTPKDVDDHVRTQIHAATHLDGVLMNGGYIAGPTHVLINTPLTNIEAMIHGIAKYGKYPI